MLNFSVVLQGVLYNWNDTSNARVVTLPMIVLIFVRAAVWIGIRLLSDTGLFDIYLKHRAFCPLSKLWVKFRLCYAPASLFYPL